MILCISPEWFNAYASLGTAIATFLLVGVAFWQLSKLNASNKTSNIMGVLEFDADITKRKTRLDDIAFEIESYSISNPEFDSKHRLLTRNLESAIEDYLNAIDRLAYCVLNNYFPEIRWKTEYGKVISDAVVIYEYKFGAASIYTNIIDLNDKWKRE